MNITTTDKVLLGITVAIATVSAGAVRIWMAFPALVASLIAVAIVVRFIDVQRNASGRPSKRMPPSNAWLNNGRDTAEQFRRRNEDVATDPSNKILVGNIWHTHSHDE